MRHQDKQQRAPISTQTSVNKMTDTEQVRTAIGAQKRIDYEHYLRMPEYKDKQLFLAHSNGDVDRWLALGAQPVPRVSKSTTIYKGINDRMDTEYQVYPSVSVIDGLPIDAFLLFMEVDEYHRLKVAPLQNRQQELDKAMGIGKASDSVADMGHVKGLKTYAPNVASDTVGLQIRRGGELQHDV
tara:strand:- start:587 stop:1138 length:552 start_codon:yes stop_codon:yes gene_type:complete